MIDPCLEIARSVWREALVGGAVIVVGTAFGWRLGASQGVPYVRAVAWWVDHVVGPLVASRAWVFRTVIIALNNATVCAVVVILGPLGALAWLGVGLLGLSLGIALRLMSSEASLEDREAEAPQRTQSDRIIESVGLALNLLEVPAIMLSAGLGLAQGALSSRVDFVTALHVFGVIAVPLLVISAGGESLWMGRHPDLPGLWRRR
jgi:hypothetical protein